MRSPTATHSALTLGRLSFYAVMTEGTYDALSDEAKAALDNSGNQTVSQSAEDAWNATADAGVATARDFVRKHIC